MKKMHALAPWCLLAVVNLALADDPSSLKSQASSLFPDGSRVVFVGDSITYDGRYTHYVEACFLARDPDRRVEFINVGLPSEGVTGLSEPAHPFPRPNVHERLGRILTQLKPDVVFACYGMNDGIYHPFTEERFAAYRVGIERLIADVTATGAKIILITPPPFDPLPIRDELRDESAGGFSWVHPYRDYDKVVERYSDWLMRMNDPRVTRVIDVRTRTLRHLEERRKTDPAYVLAADGVHTNALGQRLIAQSIVRELFGRTAVVELERFDTDPRASKLLAAVAQRQVLIGRAWMTHIGHKRPQTQSGEPIEQAKPKAAELHALAVELARALPPAER